LSQRTTAIFPGSFDPPTNGHLDLIARGARFLDHLIVAVLRNSQKQPLFSEEERVEMLREATAGIPNVEIGSFAGLLVDYAAQREANVILRGIRSAADYEAELPMAELNGRMRPGTETVLLPARAEHSFISSRMVKEIITLGGDVRPFVPEAVRLRIAAKFPSKRYIES
jgi:pantetheine-phosphate adenylyltransferase